MSLSRRAVIQTEIGFLAEIAFQPESRSGENYGINWNSDI
jgi:hypothetical protein